ncbi:hypothetical protein E2W16_01675 [Salmonella enterica]|jgi:hypothetical protein|uniref:Uncharacterized protein n=4 Tax=Salmonella enterica TaxID=28901 RepID=A0A5V4RJR5_SALER|nr:MULTISPECIES: hypothetical protein [Enterobacteriaceae]EAA1379890.1 hypothetical protein [Salmonella enterica subsp. enterica serovar Java]EBF8506241.1 hypothetical protein [Salmonella enterica subsp. enterica serovar Matopeni]EBS1496326.1 hypothetical protein [Salmonella enterica subsp. enterica serovar Concord]EBS3976228.1 hypothetical protein [Salmonella enterica subsp. enterica serovar Woodinville]EBU9307575.1 hypothetical protein [Salmonella enterica subsp. enterica serovar Javiana]ED
MSQTVSTHSENRWVPLKAFCERTGIKESTARYYLKNGKLPIKPKDKAKGRVYVDWFSWNAGTIVH